MGQALPLNHAGFRRVSRLSHLSQCFLRQAMGKPLRNRRGRGRAGMNLRGGWRAFLPIGCGAGVGLVADGRGCLMLTGPSWAFIMRRETTPEKL